MKPSEEVAEMFKPVLEWLDRGGDDQLGFNMAHWHVSAEDIDRVWETHGEWKPQDYKGTECGTACCIAGALWKFNADKLGEGPKGVARALERQFHMNVDDLDELFTPAVRRAVFRYEEVKPAQAAAVVRHWIDTGEVRWDKFDAEGNPK